MTERPEKVEMVYDPDDNDPGRPEWFDGAELRRETTVTRDPAPEDVYLSVHRPHAEIHLGADEEHVDPEWSTYVDDGGEVHLFIRLSDGGMLHGKAEVTLTPQQALDLGGDCYNAAKVASEGDDD